MEPPRARRPSDPRRRRRHAAERRARSADGQRARHRRARRRRGRRRRVRRPRRRRRARTPPRWSPRPAATRRSSSPTSRPRPTAPGSSPRPATPVDGLVLNVGIGRGGGMRGTTADDWDRTFAVNLRVALPDHPGRPARARRRRVDRVHQLRRRAATREPAPRVRRVEGRDHRAVPRRRARRARGVASAPTSSRPGSSTRPLGRWASRGRASRDRTPVPLGRQGTAAEVAAVVVVPALRRRVLRDRPDPRRRRRPHAHLTVSPLGRRSAAPLGIDARVAQPSASAGRSAPARLRCAPARVSPIAGPLRTRAR